MCVCVRLLQEAALKMAVDDALTEAIQNQCHLQSIYEVAFKILLMLKYEALNFVSRLQI